MLKQYSLLNSTRLTLLILTTSLLLNGCSTPVEKDGPPKTQIDVSQIQNPIPRKERKSRYGNPPSYVIAGKRYTVLSTAEGYNKKGIASWYGTKFHGRLTSSREPYDMLAMTAASPELPIPCYAEVTNLENGQRIIVRVNDRGPFAPNRIIDLSYTAATKLGFSRKGTALVQVKTITATPEYQLTSQSKHLHSPINHTSESSTHPQLFLQVGAFQKANNANHLQNKLRSMTSELIRVKQQHHDAHTLYLVQIGPLKAVGESDQLLQQLQQAGYTDTLTIIN